eukprot:COSAG01_NODE_2690_length_7247_cov_30.101567_8_plen_77_part_00
MHGDVFRSPKNPNLLSVVIGSGVQLITMSLITLAFAVLGFLSPANRGGADDSYATAVRLHGVSSCASVNLVSSSLL